MSLTIGVDVGGTKIAAGVVDEKGAIIEMVKRPTPAANASGTIEVISEAVRELLSRHKIEAIGIGAAGFVEESRSAVVFAPNLAWRNEPVARHVEDRTGRPVVVENDANAAALGEKWIGAGREVDDLVLLTLGTGVGGGIISGGKVLHGFVGMAGELGHITVCPTGNPCGCGNQGCLEKHASATAVESMSNLLSLGDNLSSKQVYDLAASGNEKAQHIFRIMGQALGIGIAMLINIFNYPLYLMGGGVLAAWDFFAPALLAEVEMRSFTYRNTKTRIEKAILGSEAGLYGAAYLPQQTQRTT